MLSRLVMFAFALESIQTHFDELFQNVEFCTIVCRDVKFHRFIEMSLNRFQSESKRVQKDIGKLASEIESDWSIG